MISDQKQTGNRDEIDFAECIQFSLGDLCVLAVKQLLV
jgi:hypothetical protein